MENGPSFVSGVGGQRDLADVPLEQKQAVRKAVEDVFSYLTTDERVEGLGLGLNLRHTAIAVLTSLAPGADTLVADVAAAKHGCQIVAPLPFPSDQYLR